MTFPDTGYGLDRRNLYRVDVGSRGLLHRNLDSDPPEGGSYKV